MLVGLLICIGLIILFSPLFVYLDKKDKSAQEAKDRKAVKSSGRASVRVYEKKLGHYETGSLNDWWYDGIDSAGGASIKLKFNAIGKKSISKVHFHFAFYDSRGYQVDSTIPSQKGILTYNNPLGTVTAEWRNCYYNIGIVRISIIAVQFDYTDGTYEMVNDIHYN